MTGHIHLFAKTARSGAVKTRLEPALGRHGALAVYRELLNGTIELLKASAYAKSTTVWHSPQRFQRALPSRLQARGTIGQRMAHAFAHADLPALAIGTDCPALNASHLHMAFAALESHDVVFGPAHDGGYYLIGLNSRQPRLFQGIAWSTSTVLRQSLRRAQSLGLRVALLAPLCDIDTPADWSHACNQAHSPPLSGACPVSLSNR